MQAANRKRESGEVKYLETKERMKESGSLDLKARRNNNILPIKGHPKSPGGREYCLSPNWVSYTHQFTLFRTHFTGAKPANIAKTTIHTEPMISITCRVLHSSNNQYMNIKLESYK